ncbi:hypothetical protein C8J57DRAFT_1221166 [Mycena rebaudengoi]|nr:hypothetical protein C8J57DRAFT_1221166 [Mycena rebaudengoi]
MQTSVSFKNLIQYATIAATTTKEMADSAHVPFLGSTAASVRSYKTECVQIVGQIHEILCAIVKLYTTSEANGVLPTAMMVLTFVKAQQKMGKIKQLFNQPDNITRLKTCKQELNNIASL